jgi:Skp family chaperone for outer membrane proteins
MELRVIDFEILTRNFQPYVDGYKEIESEKRKMLESVDPDKREMESIIKRSQSGLVLDEASQKRDMEAFRQIQEKLMKLDQDFKRKLKEMSDELNTNVYEQLAVIVEEWSKANSINLVMGKMEVIFNTDDIDATEQMLEAIKEKGLYYKEVETVSGEAVGPQI